MTNLANYLLPLFNAAIDAPTLARSTNPWRESTTIILKRGKPDHSVPNAYSLNTAPKLRTAIIADRMSGNTQPPTSHSPLKESEDLVGVGPYTTYYILPLMTKLTTPLCDFLLAHLRYQPIE